MSSLQVSSGWRLVVSSWFDGTLSSVLSWCIHCKVCLLKVMILLTNFTLPQRWYDGFVCLYVFVTWKILVFLTKKKIRCILQMTKMVCLLKSDKLMTFNKVRTNIQFSQNWEQVDKKSCSSNTVNTRPFVWDFLLFQVHFFMSSHSYTDVNFSSVSYLLYLWLCDVVVGIWFTVLELEGTSKRKMRLRKDSRASILLVNCPTFGPVLLSWL